MTKTIKLTVENVEYIATEDRWGDEGHHITYADGRHGDMYVGGAFTADSLASRMLFLFTRKVGS